MARNRIDYGIDLGTTNSSIARMENGQPIIKKSDLQHDTMPSCVGWNRKGVLMVGDTALNQLQSDRLRSSANWKMESNIFIEFKRTMGADKRYSPAALAQDFSSEELSAEVLKKLKSFVQDENVHAAVITVPAKFGSNQLDATARAAKLAGFDQYELLQEPIAACMAYGLGNVEKDGRWVVFDLGGGTFDAALVKAQDGLLKVLDTEGDNYLGGKNLDYAIVDELLIPYLRENYSLKEMLDDPDKLGVLRDTMKRYAEIAKIQLSFKPEYNLLSELGEIPLQDAEGNDVELDLVITSDRLAEVLGPVFQRAINLTKELLARNHVEPSSLSAVVLVGGPTYSPILREMITAQIREPDTRMDPMTAVAEGAALYACTIKVSEEVASATRDVSKIQLDLGYESTTVQTMEFVSVKLIGSNATSGLVLELERTDGTWASGRSPIDTKGDVVEVELNEGAVNGFHVRVYNAQGNRVECEPDAFNIIQGTQVSAAPLPNNIGIEILRTQDKKRIFNAVKGLEKNSALPATGVHNGLRTSRDLRPGIANDVIRIPIYEGGTDAHGSLAILNEHIYDAVITGADVPALVPAGSQVDLTIMTDRGVARPVRMKVFFPHLDEEINLEIPSASVQREVDAEWLVCELNNCDSEIDDLADVEGVNDIEIELARTELERLQERFEQNRKDYDAKKEVLEQLKTLMRKLDQLRTKITWPALKAEIQELYEKLLKANAELGNEKTTLLVQHLKQRMELVFADKNMRVARGVKDEMEHLFFMLTELYQLIGAIRYYSDNFRSVHWKDAAKASHLLERGRAMVASNPTVEVLGPICQELFALMPADEVPNIDLLTD